MRKAVGTAIREFDEEYSLLPPQVHLLDTGLLMGAPQEAFNIQASICGAAFQAARGGWSSTTSALHPTTNPTTVFHGMPVVEDHAVWSLRTTLGADRKG